MNDNAIGLRLSAQRALLGLVAASLRSASIQKDGNTIRWRCVFDVGATEEDLELARIAGSELVADSPVSTEIEEQIIIIPFPEKPTHLEYLVYHRHERVDQ